MPAVWPRLIRRFRYDQQMMAAGHQPSPNFAPYPSSNYPPMPSYPHPFHPYPTMP